MRRTSLALLSALLAVPLVTTAAGTQAASPVTAPVTAAATTAATTAATVTEVPLAFALRVGPAGRTCTVLGDLYVPSTATPASPAAAIMSTNGFGGSKDDGGERGTATAAMHYAQRGYVGLAYSGLGFGGSDCEIYLDQPAFDGRAGDLLAQFLGGRTGLATRTDTGAPYAIGGIVRTERGRAFDPVVGMIGVSYGGAAQYAVASFGRVDTIVPQITWNDLSYALAPNNTSQLRTPTSPRSVTYRTPGVSKVGWTSLFFALGLSQDASNSKLEDALAQLAADPTAPCPNFDPRACPAIVDLVTDGAPEPSTLAFARSASVSAYLSRIDVPVLLSQGQADTLFNLQESIATYAALKAQGNDVKMVWQSWGHSTASPVPGELDLRLDASRTYQGAMYAAWFDHYLLGKGPKPSLGVEYYRDHLDDGSGLAGVRRAYAKAPTYPVTTSSRLYLSGNGTLVGSTRQVTPGAPSFAAVVPAGLPSSYSEIPVLAQDQPPTDAPGTFAQWVTPPLAKPLDLAGVPAVTLTLSAPTYALAGSAGPAGQLVLFAKLYDVAPDGSLTLKHKLVAPQRIASLVRPVRLELPGVVQRFPVGHRLALVLAASDSGHRGNVLPGPVSVQIAPGTPAVLELPIDSPAARGTTSLPAPVTVAPRPATPVAGPAGGPVTARGPLAATGASALVGGLALGLLVGAGLLARRRSSALHP